MILTFHDNAQNVIHNIPVKNEITYLGITITKTFRDREDNNIRAVVQKIISGYKDYISIFGRILLTKMEEISR